MSKDLKMLKAASYLSDAQKTMIGSKLGPKMSVELCAVICEGTEEYSTVILIIF